VLLWCTGCRLPLLLTGRPGRLLPRRLARLPPRGLPRLLRWLLPCRCRGTGWLTAWLTQWLGLLCRGRLLCGSRPLRGGRLVCGSRPLCGSRLLARGLRRGRRLVLLRGVWLTQLLASTVGHAPHDEGDGVRARAGRKHWRPEHALPIHRQADDAVGWGPGWCCTGREGAIGPHAPHDGGSTDIGAPHPLYAHAAEARPCNL
jgi:hypothetical protein